METLVILGISLFKPPCILSTEIGFKHSQPLLTSVVQGVLDSEVGAVQGVLDSEVGAVQGVLDSEVGAVQGVLDSEVGASMGVF